MCSVAFLIRDRVVGNYYLVTVAHLLESFLEGKNCSAHIGKLESDAIGGVTFLLLYRSTTRDEKKCTVDIWERVYGFHGGTEVDVLAIKVDDVSVLSDAYNFGVLNSQAVRNVTLPSRTALKHNTAVFLQTKKPPE